MRMLIVFTIAIAIVLGSQWWFFGDLTSISKNIYVTIVADFLAVIILAGIFTPASAEERTITNGIIEADIRMNKK